MVIWVCREHNETLGYAVAIMEGDEALPRKNGELVFAAPWEGRVFGMAVALNDRHAYTWDEFRDRLVAQIDEQLAKSLTDSPGSTLSKPPRRFPQKQQFRRCGGG